ncbi:MAG TPA: GNAT family N-acetyltransferase [Thiobacillaceae bacterium]|nr:GNAT family N-acetyltransferase [Thiobacillaceae bacterium]
MAESAPAIRPLSLHDVEAVNALARTVWQATYPALISQAQIDAMLADRYAPERMHVQLTDPRHAWRIAWDGGEPIGFAHAFVEASGCKLDKLYVHPDRQRGGIGAALLAAIEDWARTHGASGLRLQVNRGNAQAIRAYEKYGFRIVESRVFDLGDGFVMDDHVMEKAL